MVLTLGGGDMGRGVVSALPGHLISEILDQISGRVPLEEVVEFDGVVKLAS
jgi:hypothetical protein